MRCRAPSEAAREREALEEEVEAAVARRRACGGARGRLVPLVTLRLKIEATAASTGLRCAAGTTLPNPIPYNPTLAAHRSLHNGCSLARAQLQHPEHECERPGRMCWECARACGGMFRARSCRQLSFIIRQHQHQARSSRPLPFLEPASPPAARRWLGMHVQVDAVAAEVHERHDKYMNVVEAATAVQRHQAIA